MKTLALADRHHLLAAQGWFELGNHREAHSELEKISPESRDHPDVLKLRWQIFAKSKHWQTVFSIARAICQLQPIALADGPSDASGQSTTNCAERTRPNRARHRALYPMRLPHFFAIPYNLACYACRSGNVSEAWEWLKVATEMADVSEVRRLALNDPDLEPLWNQIGEL